MPVKGRHRCAKLSTGYQFPLADRVIVFEAARDVKTQCFEEHTPERPILAQMQGGRDADSYPPRFRSVGTPGFENGPFYFQTLFQ